MLRADEPKSSPNALGAAPGRPLRHEPALLVQRLAELHRALVRVTRKIVRIGGGATELVGQVVGQPGSQPGAQFLDLRPAAEPDDRIERHAQTRSEGLAAFFISSTM